MMDISRLAVGAPIALAGVLAAACSGAPAPSSPTPPVDLPTANVYILPGAAALGPTAFGDHALLIYKGERMRWRNTDSEAHNLVTDTQTLPEFRATGLLGSGAEQSFVMNTVGATSFHCTIHPQMTGTLIVQEER